MIVHATERTEADSWYFYYSSFSVNFWDSSFLLCATNSPNEIIYFRSAPVAVQVFCEHCQSGDQAVPSFTRICLRGLVRLVRNTSSLHIPLLPTFLLLLRQTWKICGLLGQAGDLFQIAACLFYHVLFIKITMTHRDEEKNKPKQVPLILRHVRHQFRSENNIITQHHCIKRH